MQRFQPFSAVVDALKQSSTLNVVDNDTAIQRKMPLPADLQQKSHQEVQKVFEDAAMARSVYVKGFGDEQPTTQFDIEAFFNQFGPTNQVRLRRDPHRNFKGSVFVEFDSEETQKNFLALDPCPKFNGRELIVKSKKQYCDDKVADINSGKIRPNEDTGRGAREDNRNWNERREEDRKNGFRSGNWDRRGGRGGRGGSRGNRRGGRRDRNEEREYQPRYIYSPSFLLPFLSLSPFVTSSLSF